MNLRKQRHRERRLRTVTNINRKCKEWKDGGIGGGWGRDGWDRRVWIIQTQEYGKRLVNEDGKVLRGRVGVRACVCVCV